MQVITYQIGIGFDFSPILVHPFLNEKPVRRNFPTEKVYALTGSPQSIKRFRNKDRLLKQYRNRRTKIPAANVLF